ncbi:MAG: 4-hydroxy-3-methylbut-2-enyl diphosphate reductase [Acidithiobacillus sp.]|jgi:4-hydroxy-3-methylbut-2-enyl diphosphate reductase|uniref:4-hydroxy-3-methylbut-2-enyl diphosphate reductase n=1 Tax=Acidithiobacillus sp. TaxID=1872118 RepID=UPI003CFFA97A
MEILLANPRGFCAGVNRAIQIVERALDLFGAPIYVRHEVVHNRHVVEGLRERGAIFVEGLREVPDNATVIFSAHGVPVAVRQKAAARGLSVFDATCPLVTKVHMEVKKYSREGMEMILIGHAGHPEVEGTMGQVEAGMMYLVSNVGDVSTLHPRNPDKLAYITQTTLSMDDTAEVIQALRQRFPHIEGPKKDDICYATQNRQDAVKALAPQVDIMLVVGAPNSSNSSRLAELGTRLGTPTYLIEDAEQLQRDWFSSVQRIGISAGASAPESLVQGIINTLIGWGAKMPEETSGVEEKVTFSLPLALVQAQSRQKA